MTKFMVRCALGACFLPIVAGAHAGTTTTIERVQVTDLGGGDYSFIQGGYGDGATFSGTFSGVDSNGDGRLTGDAIFGELTAFTATFSGNRHVAAVSLDQTDGAFQIVYDLDGTGVLGDASAFMPGESIEGFGATGFEFAIGALVRTNTPCDGASVCGMLRGPSPDPVPEPTVLALLGLGTVALAAARRR